MIFRKDKWYNNTWWKRTILVITLPIWIIPVVFIIFCGIAILESLEEVVKYIKE